MHPYPFTTTSGRATVDADHVTAIEELKTGETRLHLTGGGLLDVAEPIEQVGAAIGFDVAEV